MCNLTLLRYLGSLYPGTLLLIIMIVYPIYLSADSGVEDEIASLRKNMVSIPAGSFMMGDASGEGDPDELPVHKVNIRAFKMSRYEITFSLWDACLADGGCYSYRPSDRGWGRGNRPVINVTWDEVQNFIEWLNMKTGKHYRLPSEAEWEYAARAGTKTEYSWGDKPVHNQANCQDCGDPPIGETTFIVGSFKANRFGLYDMQGNAWEWVADCWNTSYMGAPVDGSAWTKGDCSKRVIRGGSWFSQHENLRSANRSFNGRSLSHSIPGFRLAHD